MTKFVVMSDHSWIALKIRSLIFSESEFLRKAIRNIRDKICNFEKKYGTSDPESLFGQADDMDILEWEGEIETVKKVTGKAGMFLKKLKR